MEKFKNNKKFIEWCKRLYDENCLERHRHGLKPNESFDVYYNQHTNWLWAQYQNALKKDSIYLT
ncbi:MAG TPA: hypothetical protein DCM10_00040 [Xanthomarina gelatinilytica]|nr:hypothetical protein [Xanthomarina gelatinilytica]